MVFCYLLTAFLMTFGALLATRSRIDQQVAHRQRNQSHAFQLAEAGIDQALIALRANYDATAVATTSLGAAQTYAVSITQEGDVRTIRSTGTSSEESTATKQIEVKVQRSIPANFYDNAIYGSSTITINGNAYSVTGDVVTGDENLVNNVSHITGQVFYDPAASPLPKLSFAQLHEIAASQGNVFDSGRLNGIKHGTDSFPTSFCYSPPTDPNDPTTCTPNVNYVTTDLVLNGDIGTIGGLFVVVGNVLTDPSTTEDTTINGNGQIAGMVYTSGAFTVNGGGGGLNVSGGVWAGKKIKINGNISVSYNADYMQAVKHMELESDLRVLYWQECAPGGC